MRPRPVSSPDKRREAAEILEDKPLKDAYSKHYMDLVKKHLVRPMWVRIPLTAILARTLTI
jgi:hypothetical protein